MGSRYDIHDRIFNFVIQGLELIRYIPQSPESKSIIDQYVRALTSVGANDSEADGVTTKKDFIHTYTIVRKELKETHYWLRIISKLHPQLSQRVNNLLVEGDSFIKIISSIIISASK